MGAPVYARKANRRAELDDPVYQNPSKSFVFSFFYGEAPSSQGVSIAKKTEGKCLSEQMKDRQNQRANDRQSDGDRANAVDTNHVSLVAAQQMPARFNLIIISQYMLILACPIKTYAL